MTHTPRTVLITGASSGIGRATALQLADEGANLVLLARSLDVLQTVRQECEDRGAKALVTVADVRDVEALDAAFAGARTAFGVLDGVVHSAGSLAYGRFEDVPAEVFNSSIEATLIGTANVARCALREFKEAGGGSLVFLGSLLGKISTPFMSSYITAKWGVHGLVRTLQIEARSTPGIHISLVSPGGVDTPVYLQAGTYLGRHGRPPPPVDPPEKVARAVVRALDRPRRETSVGLANHVVVGGFRLSPAVYDLLVTSLMKTGGLSRGEVPNSPGNVLAPLPLGEAVHGRWGRRWTSGLSLAGSPVAAVTPGTPPGEQIVDQSPGVVTVTREVEAPSQAVWDVLADGWSYATWVVGASRVRDVDVTWPAQGAQVHHSFGLWPALINDATTVERSVEPSLLVLTARGWPLGEARVVISITPRGERACTVKIAEDASRGPGKLLPRPGRQLAIGPRNVEALRRLAFLAEGRFRNGETSA
ncbi:SDR family NAD(P)-dependent oxidoreductase [Ornithinimicrobium pratense]|uniref:SDR family NAD(P)-dependent oxidoreductase n=1 Tax=Ornithinimicrobium pratense TaxID=2593973 RepID=UPI00192E2347|nr:SDR family NAD(P)-dependent oxidoreductase [Ornithinimicrobium pratense]